MPAITGSRAEEILRGRSQVLQDLARGAGLEEILTGLARAAEEVFPGMRCAVLLLDEGRRRLHHAAAPSLPDAYVNAIDGLVVGPEVGSCGAAAATGERFVVEDVAEHPNWAPFRSLAATAGFRACWSEPILSSAGEVLGTLAMYYDEPRSPGDQETRLIRTGAQLAGIAIEAKRTEERLRESEERFRQMAETIGEVFWLTDWKRMEVLYVSPAYEKIWGRSCESLYADARSWSYDIHPEDRERMMEAFARDTERGEYDEEYRLVRPDGEVRWIHDRAFPIRDEQGEIYRVAGISEDVTEKKRTELSLRESDERFRQLAENVQGIFWLTDWEKRQVLYASPTWEAIWGCSTEVLMGDDRTGWTRNIHPEDRQRVVEAFERDAERGEYDIDFRILHPDGSVRWLHERAFPIHDGQGRVHRMAGVVVDVTDRKRVELELRQARDELDAQRRVQIKSLTSQLLLAEERERRRLAMDLHDGMGQTLSLARLKLAQLREASDDGVRAALAEVEALIEDVSRSSRSLTFQLSPPILHDLGFEPALQWLVEDIHKNHGLEIELDGPEDATPLDERVRVLLYRAVRELLINVARHADAHRARVLLARRPDAIWIRVEDDGVAFDPEVVGSRGLGLSGIRERLSHLGGIMSIESRPGSGTRVTLAAPRRPTNGDIEEERGEDS